MSTKQLFYNETLTRTKVVNNILRVFEASKKADVNGFNWYNDAHNFATELSKSHIRRLLDGCIKGGSNIEKLTINPLTKYHVAGIISALSPLQKWERNKDLTIQFIELLESGADVMALPCMKANVTKCVKIAQLKTSGTSGETLINDIKTILNGSKTVSFFLNIAMPLKSNEVTIDRHALSIALGKKLSNEGFKNHSMTKAQYNFFRDCYLLAAKKVGRNGLAIQAQTWEFWRVEGAEFQSQLNNLLNLKD